MHQKVKITKRQLKEDKFTTFMLQSKDRLQESWQFFVIGAVVVVLAVVAVVYFFESKTKASEEAGAKFAQALMDYRGGNNQVAVLSFAQIVEDYGDQPVAEYATYLLGNANYRQRSYEEAIRYYQEYLSRYKGDLLVRSGALAGIAACREDQGQYQEAADRYEAAIAEYPDGPQIGDYHLSAMRCFLAAENKDKASEHLNVLRDSFPGTQLAERANRRAAEGGLF
jgi:TolA-binding protein